MTSKLAIAPGGEGGRIGLYDAARHALAEARRVDEVKGIRDKAIAMQAYAAQAMDRALIEDATEIRMRAERRAGELLLELDKNKGTRGQGRPQKGGNGQRPPKDETPKLSEFGINKTQSSRWQRLAAVDAETFETKVIPSARKKAAGGLDIVHRDIRQKAERAAAYEKRMEHGCTVDDLRVLADGGYRAGVIYVDVPSRFETYSGEGKQRSADRHYDTESLDALKAMGPLIQALAARDCALLFWTSGALDEQAHEIIRAWGFDYKTWAFVWVKTKPASGVTDPNDLTQSDLHWGLGYSTRANVEAVLLATRGAPFRLNNDVHQVAIAPAAEHSAKPEEVRRRIERLYSGPYLELFGRKPVDGWTVFGNEIPRDQFRAQKEMVE